MQNLAQGAQLAAPARPSLPQVVLVGALAGALVGALADILAGFSAQRAVFASVLVGALADTLAGPGAWKTALAGALVSVLVDALAAGGAKWTVLAGALAGALADAWMGASRWRAVLVGSLAGVLAGLSAPLEAWDAPAALRRAPENALSGALAAVLVCAAAAPRARAWRRRGLDAAVDAAARGVEQSRALGMRVTGLLVWAGGPAFGPARGGLSGAWGARYRLSAPTLYETRMVDWFYRWHTEPDRTDWVEWLAAFELDRPPVHRLHVEGGPGGGAAIRVELDFDPAAGPGGSRRLAVERPAGGQGAPAEAAWVPVAPGDLALGELARQAFGAAPAAY